MYCDQCGTELRGGESFCPSCGKEFPSPAASAPRARPATHARTGRVAANATLLGVVWIIWSVIHLFPFLGVMIAGAVNPHWLDHSRHVFWHVPGATISPGGLIAAVGGLMGLATLIGLIAGIGMLSLKPWSRVLLIVLAVFALLSFPLGTILGIYTLWVLLSREAEVEFARLSHSR